MTDKKQYKVTVAVDRIIEAEDGEEAGILAENFIKCALGRAHVTYEHCEWISFTRCRDTREAPND